MKLPNRWKTILGGILGAGALGGILMTGGGKSPAPPSAEVVAMWEATCRALYVEELQRPIDPSGLTACVEAARAGGTAETLRANLRASDEYKALQKKRAEKPAEEPKLPDPVVGTLSRIAIEGRFWTPRPVFASCLAVLAKDVGTQDAVLDEVRALGFNGCRPFAGRLSWAGQTADAAAAALPRFLRAAAARGLYVYPSAITDSKDGGYDVEAHLRRIAEICATAVNCVLEAANEIGHPTQSDRVNDIPGFLAIARRVIPSGVVWTLGSPIGTDEPDPDGKYPTDGGLFNDAHLDRGRDPFNQVRRLREIAAISEVTKKPAMSGEPIGAAEQPIPGKRTNDPAFFFAMGALCRGFEIGCVFHSEDGLQGRLLGPGQRAAAAAFIAGIKAIPTTDRLQFMNARWAGSPVEEANFESGVVRAYSFVAGARGWTVLVGVRGDPGVRWGAGWRAVKVAAERQGVQVVEIQR